jgi:hypothetical protein
VGGVVVDGGVCASLVFPPRFTHTHTHSNNNAHTQTHTHTHTHTQKGEESEVVGCGNVLRRGVCLCVCVSKSVPAASCPL